MNILKANATGFGLLVENDAGYISPQHNREFIKEIREKVVNKKFDLNNPRVIAVMQKYGIENRNGRIYPEAILRREAKNYQRNIEMGTSVGENDHPECFSDDALVLTQEGWMLIQDVKDDTLVFTLNSSSYLELQTVDKVIHQQYHGKMYRVKHELIDCLVTPLHRFLCYDKNDADKKHIYINANELNNFVGKNYVLHNGIKTDIHTQEEELIAIDDLEITIEDYDSKIACLSLKNANFYVKQNDKCFWTGNSAVISIRNTSMKVTKLWWEGRTLMGEILLPITRGFIEQGIMTHPADKIANDMMYEITYGVSSRGVGSVQSKGDVKIVQDDFELICWDFVTTPSTIGSWTALDKNDLKPYIESVEKHEKNIDFGIKKSLNDFLAD